jgi:AcrR family transcriptional regulator
VKAPPLDPIYYKLMESDPKTWPLAKLQILNAFFGALADEGVENVNLEKLAKKLGMARSHVAYYFKNRELLHKDAMSFIAFTAQQITMAVWEAAPAGQKTRAIVNGAFAWAERLPEHAVAFGLLQYYASFRPAYRGLLTKIRGEGRKRLAGSMALDRPSLLKDQPRLEARALRMQLLISAYLTEALTTGLFASLAEARQACLDACEEGLG